MRVGIIGLLHESNTFIAEPTTMDHFRQDTLLTGSAIREKFAGTSHEFGGFFDGLDQEGIDAVPVFTARAVPFGPITADTFEQLLRMMQTEVSASGPLDGILVAPHGATVSEKFPDADGHWLQQLRKHVGPSLPIIGTVDAHANLSQQMVDATNALTAYRTNPHLDQRDRGKEAAALMAACLRGEIRPVQHAEFPPLIINIERQMTSESPLAELHDFAAEARKKKGVLSNSILLGFPYADVAEMGSAVLVVTDGDRNLAQSEARGLSDRLWNHRHELVGQMINMDDAVRDAAALKGPVCLLDMGDNVGGGSPGDSTHLAHTVLRHDKASALICICDPQAVEQSAAAGAGATVPLRIGGHTDTMHGSPLIDNWTVDSLHDGKFTDTQTRHGGFTQYDQGQSAVVHSGNGRLTVLLTSRRMPPFSLVQLTSCGLDPGSFQLIVAKGVNAPVAAYEPVCESLIRVNSPGCTTADLGQLEFHHRRNPLFPFEVVTRSG